MVFYPKIRKPETFFPERLFPESKFPNGILSENPKTRNLFSRMNFFPNGVLSENPKTRNLFYRTPFTRKKYNIKNAVALSLNILKSTNYMHIKIKII